MTEPDAFDPLHALDGWRLPAPGPVDLTLGPARHGAAQPHGGPALCLVHAVPEAFDPTRALDGWRAPAAAPLDLDLRSLLRPRAAPPDEAKKAWLKRRGYALVDIEDIHVPDPPRRAPVAAAACQRLLDESARADNLDAPALPRADAALAPGLDTRAAPAASLPGRWQPHAWVAQVRCLAPARVDVHHAHGVPRVDDTPPSWLCALWPPPTEGAPVLARWPDLATVISAGTADEAMAQALRALPAPAVLWRADEREADWALLAGLVLLHQAAGLTPSQARALHDLAAAERGATQARMTDHYCTDGRVARRRT